MAADLEALTQALVTAAKKAGADAADAVTAAGDSLSIHVRDRALEHAERAEGVEIGLRVLIGKRQACVSANDTRPETLAAMAERAVAMAREAPEDPWCGLADPEQLARSWDLSALDLVDPDPLPDPESLKERALEAEAAARAVPGVTRMDGATTGWSVGHVHLATSNGFSGGRAQSTHVTSVVAICGDGTAMERDYAAELRTHLADLPDARDIGQLAGERTVARHGPRKPPTGAFPVLFDERVAVSLIAHLFGAINGAAIARGSSWLKDAMGERVLPAGIDLAEEPLRPRISGSRPFDDEGLAVGERLFVEDGILRSWVLDLATGRQLGLPSTANANRGFSGPPTPSAGNVRLTQGAQSRADLMAEMGTGLLVTSMLGASINPTTGDYSRGASGFWVEKGEIVHAVNECTIAGNLRPMLTSIRPANDARPWSSRIVPSLLVEGLVVAGS